MLPSAVSGIIRAIGIINAQDVFLDVGAGIGNVVTKFPLQSRDRLCIGLVDLSTEREREEYWSLYKGPVLCCNDCVSQNILFTEDVHIAVVEELYYLPSVRVIITTRNFCPRHRYPCRDMFCSVWLSAGILDGLVSWTSTALYAASDITRYQQHRYFQHVRCSTVSPSCIPPLAHVSLPVMSASDMSDKTTPTLKTILALAAAETFTSTSALVGHLASSNI
ncbi:histone H3-K79 methyltransferase [Phytophthora cactorum]|nr:histone H3-K79 methyltransferase [Phytophthora cactorum]